MKERKYLFLTYKIIGLGIIKKYTTKGILFIFQVRLHHLSNMHHAVLG